MNDPAILFYTSDFLTGVIDMTMEERGQYITLLCYQHQKGHIKEETIRLLVGSCSVNVLKHFDKDENGNYYNERMDLEKEKRHVFTESRRENGKKGGRPKKQNDKPNGKPKENLVDNHMGNHMGNENDNDNINSNLHNNNNKSKYGEFKNVLLTDEEHHKLEISNLLTYIEKLSSYIASTGKRYKSHYATILNWSRKDGKNTNKELADKLVQDIKEEEASEEEIKALEDRIKNR